MLILNSANTHFDLQNRYISILSLINLIELDHGDWITHSFDMDCYWMQIFWIQFIMIIVIFVLWEGYVPIIWQ